MNFNSFSEAVNIKTLEDYEVIINSRYPNGIIGKGAFSIVKLVKDKASGQHFAMKMIAKSELIENSSIVQMKQEIKIHKKLNHPHIIKLYSFFEDKYFIYMILEYAENGTLYNYMKKRKVLTESEAFIFFFQTCLGIDYLHKHDVMHRDLKPENLLLDAKGNIKLCDFGWSAENITYKKQTFCGTLNYMAPEMFQNENYNYKVDIWGLGILLYEILHGFPPDAYHFVLNKNFLDIKENISKSAKELISDLLKYNPQERLGLNEVFHHSWLLNFEELYNIKIETFLTNQKKIILENPNKENVWKKEASIDATKTKGEIRVIYAKSLNKYNENLHIIENNNKIFKKNQDHDQLKEVNTFIDKFLSAIGCVKRDKLITKKKNILS